MVTGHKVDKDLMRKSNMKLVLSVIFTNVEVSKAKVAESTGMSIVSVGRIVESLIALGLVQEQEKEPEPNLVGRPPKVLSLNTEKLLCCSVHLVDRGVRFGLIDPYGGLHATLFHSYPEGEAFTPERVLPWVAELLQRYLERHNSDAVLDTVGVVVPGIVDIVKGELSFSANWKWKGVAILDYLRKRFPAYGFLLENDTKAMAVAEHRFGGSSSCQNMVVFHMGTGIGAAVILNGAIYRGKDNMAGEIGHIVLNPAGKLCECGQAGCLQTNLTQRAILTEAHNFYPDTTMTDLVEKFRQGEPFAVALIQRLVDYISISMNLLANTYAPEVLLLCGDTIRENPGLCQLVEENYQNKLNDYMQNTFELRFESFGVDGHLIGGGALAFEQVLDTLF